MIFGRAAAPSRQDVIKQLITLSKYNVEVQGGSKDDGNIIRACDLLLRGESVPLYNWVEDHKKYVDFRASMSTLPKLTGLLDPKHTGLTKEEIEVAQKMEELANMGHKFTADQILSTALPAVIASFRVLKGLPIIVDNAIVLRGSSLKTVMDDVSELHEKFSEVANARKELGDISNSQPQKPVPPEGKLKLEGIDN